MLITACFASSFTLPSHRFKSSVSNFFVETSFYLVFCYWNSRKSFLFKTLPISNEEHNFFANTVQATPNLGKPLTTNSFALHRYLELFNFQINWNRFNMVLSKNSTSACHEWAFNTNWITFHTHRILWTPPFAKKPLLSCHIHYDTDKIFSQLMILMHQTWFKPIYLRRMLHLK